MTTRNDPKDKPETTHDDAPLDRTSAQHEKLSQLSDMKYDLERQSGRGTSDLEQLQARIASVDVAVLRVKNS
ncbi:MAG: hypothetical protein ACSHXI_02165 [Hoeflea sp.]|uniref:hypothetical protein n=1 Tax=Hoeflea sp. TaxID=1940281 RepID=UPI003EFA5AB0